MKLRTIAALGLAGIVGLAVTGWIAKKTDFMRAYQAATTTAATPVATSANSQQPMVPASAAGQITPGVFGYNPLTGQQSYTQSWGLGGEGGWGLPGFSNDPLTQQAIAQSGTGALMPSNLQFGDIMQPQWGQYWASQYNPYASVLGLGPLGNYGLGFGNYSPLGYNLGGYPLVSFYGREGGHWGGGRWGRWGGDRWGGWPWWGGGIGEDPLLALELEELELAGATSPPPSMYL